MRGTRVEPRFHKGAIVSSHGSPESPPTVGVGADHQFTESSRSLIHVVVTLTVEGPEWVSGG